MPAPTPATQVPYPVTGSDPFYGGKSATKTSLSTMIIIKVGDNAVGAIQKLSIDEKRDVKMIDEVGTDGHIDSAPTKSSDVSGSCERIRFDRMRVSEAFSRGFLHVKSQRVPFDIQIIDTMGGTEDSGSAIVTIIQNVWIVSISYGYDANNWIISDNMQWQAETIYSYISAPNTSAAQQGLRTLTNVPWDVYEVAADVGMRRGAMDSPDLINAPLSA